MSSRPTTTASTAPIAPARFAAALVDLSLPTLHLKLLEIRNSISHLRTSNIQLLPFALGTETAIGAAPGEPDPDCADAIRENEAVIARMQDRIALIRSEVEGRGTSWREFEAPDDDAPAAEGTTANGLNGLQAARDEEDRIARGSTTATQTQPPAGGAVQHPAWSDGTFQTGTIRGGVLQYDSVPGASFSVAGARNPETNPENPAAASGGSLSDEELRRRMEAQLRGLGDDNDDDDSGAQGGMHL